MNASRLLALACVAALSSGCVGGEETSTSREPSGPTSSEPIGTDPASLVGNVQSRTLELPNGVSRASFKITALPPPEHTWDVYVDAPTRADVAVRIRTWYGTRLRVLDSTDDKTSCDMQAGRSVCSLAFPRLEAQRPGEWTVIVVKRSQPAARVRVEVIFNQE